MVSFSELRRKWGLAMPFDRASDEVLPLKYKRVLHERLCADVPEVDAFENAREVVVIVHAPGVRKEHLRLRLTEKELKLVLDNNPRKEGFQPEFMRQNRVPPLIKYVAFSVPVDPRGAKAVFKNGVLELTVPKKNAVSWC